MAKIEIKIDTEKDLTIFTVEGILTATEILQYSSEYYEKSPTKNVLWDATLGSVSNITNEEFMKIAKDMKKITQKKLITGYRKDFYLTGRALTTAYPWPTLARDKLHCPVGKNLSLKHGKLH